MVLGRLIGILEVVDGGESQWVSGWREETSGRLGNLDQDVSFLLPVDSLGSQPP